MKDRKYVILLVLISLVILTTLSIQLYWNYKNYKESEQQLIADVQTSLDQSVERYFTTRARENTMGIFFNGSIKDGALKEFFSRVDDLNSKNKDGKASLKDVDVRNISGVRVLKGVDKDSLERYEEFLKLNPDQSEFRFPTISKVDSIATKRRFQINTPTARVEGGQFNAGDSLSVNFRFREEVSSITNKIVLSMTDDSIDIEQIDSLFNAHLKSKKINLDYTMVNEKDAIQNPFKNSEFPFNAIANSSLIKNNQQLSVHYGNLTMQVLKRNLTGILLSFLLIASVIFCLFYLLVIINNQKELSSMKNDLISNITHEFKTPIATAGAALEGVQSFTNSGDTEKTHRYLDLGRAQLEKLNTMVEKLLETATLDSKDLALQKSHLDLKDLLETCVARFKTQSEKTILFESKINSDAFMMGDQFHLENAINNLLDNAIKYGGEEVRIELNKAAEFFAITVTDSGTALESKHVKRLFDKFYRVGSGNKHNVKGFGIGLFYTKAIIEKHDGVINVTNKPSTSFKILLPYE